MQKFKFVTLNLFASSSILLTSTNLYEHISKSSQISQGSVKGYWKYKQKKLRQTLTKILMDKWVKRRTDSQTNEQNGKTERVTKLSTYCVRHINWAYEMKLLRFRQLPAHSIYINGLFRSTRAK